MSDLSSPQLNTLCVFKEITIQELPDTTAHMTPSSSLLNIIPTKFLLEVLDIVAPCLLSIINSSLFSGCGPSYIKTASVQPPLKKHSSDPSDYSNYRLISKPTFISKILEKTVSNQLLEVLINNNIF